MKKLVTCLLIISCAFAMLGGIVHYYHLDRTDNHPLVLMQDSELGQYEIPEHQRYEALSDGLALTTEQKQFDNYQNYIEITYTTCYRIAYGALLVLCGVGAWTLFLIMLRQVVSIIKNPT